MGEGGGGGGGADPLVTFPSGGGLSEMGLSMPLVHNVIGALDQVQCFTRQN